MSTCKSSKMHLLKFHFNRFKMNENNPNERLEKLIESLTEQLKSQQCFGEWVSRERVKRFFDYGETQILQLSKEPSIITSRIGNRVFFKSNSLLDFIEKNYENHELEMRVIVFCPTIKSSAILYMKL